MQGSPQDENMRISLLKHMRDILVSFFINISSVIFFWLPGSDPVNGYILLAFQTLCYALVVGLFFALPFIRLFIAGCKFAYMLGKWVLSGCGLEHLRNAVCGLKQGLITPFYRLFELLTGRSNQFRISTAAADGAETHVPVTMAGALEKYGSWTVQSLKIRREPFSGLTNKGLDVITFGAWSTAMASSSVDAFYHLALIMRLRSQSGEECVVVLEKNALVNMSDYFSSNEQQSYHIIRGFPKITLNKFIENAYSAMNEAFFPFDAFHNNCANFILGILSANMKLTKAAIQFINQPIDKVLDKLPAYTTPLAKIMTQFSAALDIIIHNDI
jgi:hypothetical protein